MTMSSMQPRRALYAGAAGFSLLIAFAAHAAPTSPKPRDGARPSVSAKPSLSKPSLSQTVLPQEKLRYNRDIRPILAENCFACHGPDSAARKAGSAPGQVRAGHRAQERRCGDRAGQARAERGDPPRHGQGPVMPPAEGHKRLTTAQIALLKRWIGEGAQYEQHWAYLAPVASRPARREEPAMGAKTPLTASFWPAWKKRA